MKKGRGKLGKGGIGVGVLESGSVSGHNSDMGNRERSLAYVTRYRGAAPHRFKEKIDISPFVSPTTYAIHRRVYPTAL